MPRGRLHAREASGTSRQEANGSPASTFTRRDTSEPRIPPAARGSLVFRNNMPTLKRTKPLATKHRSESGPATDGVTAEPSELRVRRIALTIIFLMLPLIVIAFYHMRMFVGLT